MSLRPKPRRVVGWRLFAIILGALLCAGFSISSATANPNGGATSPLYYRGQGIPVHQKCDANNDPYLLFVFTGGSATNVQLHGITVNDTKVTNGSVHFTTPYVDPPSSLIGKVYATWTGDAGKNPQLVISHGCSGEQTPPPTCPPGTVGTPPNCTTPPPPPPTQVTPAAPTASTPSCTTPDETVTPSSQAGVVWTPSGTTALKPGETVTYTASPAKGYTFPQGATTSWTFKNTFSTSTCTTPPPVKCKPGQKMEHGKCTTPPPATCKHGTVGTPPHCTTPPVKHHGHHGHKPVHRAHHPVYKRLSNQPPHTGGAGTNSVNTWMGRVLIVASGLSLVFLLLYRRWGSVSA